MCTDTETSIKIHHLLAQLVRILPFVAIPHYQASRSINYGIIHAMYYWPLHVDHEMPIKEA